MRFWSRKQVEARLAIDFPDRKIGVLVKALKVDDGPGDDWLKTR